MLNNLKRFFDEHLQSSGTDDASAEKLQLACAALFLEMMMMDDVVEAREQQVILQLLRDNFSLSNPQATALIERAEQHRLEATDYYRFTALINKEYSQEQKVQLVESLWKIAFIDGTLDLQEEFLVRKIADLLYVPHSTFMLKKHQVSEAQ